MGIFCVIPPGCSPKAGRDAFRSACGQAGDKTVYQPSYQLVIHRRSTPLCCQVGMRYILPRYGSSRRFPRPLASLSCPLSILLLSFRSYNFECLSHMQVMYPVSEPDPEEQADTEPNHDHD